MTLLLSREHVSGLIDLPEVIEAVEEAFRMLGNGELPDSAMLGLHAPAGGLHVKGQYLPEGGGYFVAKLNANLPDNARRHGLPVIQGLIAVFDADNGKPLAVMDSIDITIKRTAAASAIAARRLARAGADTLTVCGCGVQGRAHVAALAHVLTIRRLMLHDRDPAQAHALALEAAKLAPRATVEIVAELAPALQASSVIATCTSARSAFVFAEHIPRGAFIAATGADAPRKQEVDPAVFDTATVVVDSLEQCRRIGDLHHAVAGGRRAEDLVDATLAEVICGTKPGRTDIDEVILFDSTGLALQDAACAVRVWQRAVQRRLGQEMAF